jgi:hypothetical protein
VSIEERERDPEGRTASALYRKRIYTQLCGGAILWMDGCKSGWLATAVDLRQYVRVCLERERERERESMCGSL